MDGHGAECAAHSDLKCGRQPEVGSGNDFLLSRKASGEFHGGPNATDRLRQGSAISLSVDSPLVRPSGKLRGGLRTVTVRGSGAGTGHVGM